MKIKVGDTAKVHLTSGRMLTKVVEDSQEITHWKFTYRGVVIAAEDGYKLETIKVYLNEDGSINKISAVTKVGISKIEYPEAQKREEESQSSEPSVVSSSSLFEKGLREMGLWGVVWNYVKKQQILSINSEEEFKKICERNDSPSLIRRVLSYSNTEEGKSVWELVEKELKNFYKKS
jgi:hypothetical protein